MFSNIHYLKQLKLCIFFIFFIFEFSAFAQRPKQLKAPTTSTANYTLFRKGVLLDLSYFLYNQEQTSRPSQVSDGKNQTSVLDLRLGYINQAAFYYGIGYTFKNDNNQSVGTSGRGTAFGLGYFWTTGFDFRGYYRSRESYGDYSNGDGIQVSLGYTAKLNSLINIGVNLDYREIKYLSYLYDPNMDYKLIKSIQPAIALGIYF